ncbi:MAG: quaternary amine ABC transporter ATP-binding protein [Chloroflexota bacterium]
MVVSVSVQNVYKIFGPTPEEGRDLYLSGVPKEEIQARTGNVMAVADVSFDVEQGEIFVVMGLSGSGKSTLIRCINRLWEPTFGTIVIDGNDLVQMEGDELRALRREKIAMVFQHFGLFPHKTVLENAGFGLKMQGVPEEERRVKAQEALDMVGLSQWANYRPENLSGGMQQRVGLARALATNADILLMDEAFSALDPLIRREMQDELLQLQENLQKTIIFITHDLNEALKLGDRTAIMRDGAIVQIGTAEEIVSSPATDYVFEFTRDVDRGRVLSVGSIMRSPETLLQNRDSVRTAMARMRAIDSDYMVLVDDQRQPVGLVMEEDVARASREGVNDLGQIAVKDFPEVQVDQILMEVFEAATSGHCLVVVDEQRHLKGVVERLDIIANLSASRTTGRDGANGADAEEEAPQQATAAGAE